MGKKYYGIKKGFDFNKNHEVFNIIVESWDECLKYVKGAKGAIYKSFQSLNEAKSYLEDERRILKKGIDSYPLDIPHAYVDGSFNSATGRYGYGLVVIVKGIIVHVENGGAENDSQKALRQISGELKAAIRAVEFAALQGYKEIVIFHDYEGICHHATGAWERRDQSSQEYYNRINFLREENEINIIFVKVDSHTNDLFNEIADEQAKYGAGLSLNHIVDKLIKNDNIKVADNEAKNILKLIVSSQYHKNITILNEAEITKEVALEKEVPYIEEVTEKILKFSHKEQVINYAESLDESTKDNLIVKLWSIITE